MGFSAKLGYFGRRTIRCRDIVVRGGHLHLHLVLSCRRLRRLHRHRASRCEGLSLGYVASGDCSLAILPKGGHITIGYAWISILYHPPTLDYPQKDTLQKFLYLPIVQQAEKGAQVSCIFRDLHRQDNIE